MFREASSQESVLQDGILGEKANFGWPPILEKESSELKTSADL